MDRTKVLELLSKKFFALLSVGQGALFIQVDAIMFWTRGALLYQPQGTVISLHISYVFSCQQLWKLPAFKGGVWLTGTSHIVFLLINSGSTD